MVVTACDVAQEVASHEGSQDSHLILAAHILVIQASAAQALDALPTSVGKLAVVVDLVLVAE